jgi:hypothetical protein
MENARIVRRMTGMPRSWANVAILRPSAVPHAARRRIAFLMERILLFSLLLVCRFAVAQLHQYKTTDIPRAGENIAQPCECQASFPAGQKAVKAAWVTYDRGPDVTRFYSDPDVLAFAKRNDVAMVLAWAAETPSPGRQNHTVSTSAIVRREHFGFFWYRTTFPTAASSIPNPLCSTGCKRQSELDARIQKNRSAR